MRSEAEMMALIMDFLQSDPRVRAAVLNGSRANPNAPKDCLQDFDVACFVTDMESFLQDHTWVDRFGKRAIMQLPETSTLFPHSEMRRFAYLMQFCDGNRIDLSLVPTEYAAEHLREDSMALPLLDKDGLLGTLPPPSDAPFHIKRPTAQNFADCCNEFWWVAPYVGKGLWRGELLFAIEHLLHYMQPMLLLVLDWKVGFETGFSLGTGKCHKYLQPHLSIKDWQALMAIYNTDSTAACWAALHTSITLFRKTAQDVAEKLGLPYPLEDDQNVMDLLQKMHISKPNVCPF